MAEKKITIFNFFNAIIKGSKVSKEEELNFDKVYNTWLANMHFSCHPSVAILVNDINKGVISKKANFMFLKGISKQHLNTSYIQYLSSKPKQEKTVEYISRRFDCSLNVAKEYLSVLDKKEIKAIYEEYERLDNPSGKIKKTKKNRKKK